MPSLRAELKIGGVKAHYNLSQWQRPEPTVSAAKGQRLGLNRKKQFAP